MRADAYDAPDRLHVPIAATDPEPFTYEVAARMGVRMAFLRIVTSTGRLVPLALVTDTDDLRVALEDAAGQGRIGGVVPRQLDRAIPVAEGEVGALLGDSPRVLTEDAWIENVAIHDGERLAGLFTIIGASDAACPRLSPDERTTLKHQCRMLLRAYLDGRARERLERKVRFMTDIGRGLASHVPLSERLKRAVVATQESLGFDSVQLITWNPTRETLLLHALYVRDMGFMPDRTWDAMTPSEVHDAVRQFRRSPEPLIVPDPAELPQAQPWQRTWMKKHAIRFLVFVPLMHEREQYGTLVLTSPFSRKETTDRLAMLTSVGGHFGALLQLSLVHAEIEESYARLRSSHLNTVETLAMAAEMRDKTTGEHLRNLRTMSRRIGRKLGLSGSELEDLGFAAVVHDVGKLQIPDAVLLKPAKLTREEFELIKTHTVSGEAILTRSELPAMARDVVRWHHERWDGSGYPDGLRAGAIPLAVQIVTIADVFDALVSDRPYKRAWPVEQAIDEIIRGRGAHFSPDIVDAFLALELPSAPARADWRSRLVPFQLDVPR